MTETKTHDHRLTVNETAKRLHRTPKTIYRWISEGFMHNIIKVRDGYLIPTKEIERIEKIVNPTS